MLGGQKDNLLVTADTSTKVRDGVLRGDPCHRTAKKVKVEDAVLLVRAMKACLRMYLGLSSGV